MSDRYRTKQAYDPLADAGHAGKCRMGESMSRKMRLGGSCYEG